MTQAPIGAMIDFGPIQLDPVAIGSQGNAVLGIRDSGKTYTATLLAEGLFDAGVPFIAFDPIGVWRFLRVPGAGRGYPVVVAGGLEPDLPLTPAAVPALVEAAMKNGVSLVLDLFDINLSKADWRRIVMAALRTLLHKNHQYGLRHVFIEEAAEFAPQKVTDGLVYAEMEKLARMGGNARLGYTLINQRSEEVNKALLELCDNLFLHRQKGRNSLTALSKWLDIGNVTDGKQIVSSLSTLPTGECWAWMAGSDAPSLVKVPTKNSLHPDRRVMRGDAPAVGLAKAVDVGAFVQGMKAALGKVTEEAEANDPKALKAEIARLKQLLAKVPEGIGPDAVAQARSEGYEAGRGDGELAERKRQVAAALDRHKRAVEHLDRYLDQDLLQDGGPTDLPITAASAPPVVQRQAKPAPPPRPSEGSAAVTGPQRRVLNALAWWRAFGINEPTNEQVGFIAGYSPGSGGFANLKGGLRGAGLVEYPAGGRLALTDQGAAAAEMPDVEITREAFHAQVRAKLSGPQVKVLDPILAAYPEAISSSNVADIAGYSAGSGGFANLRGSLRSIGLIDYPAGGMVRAADWLFP